VNYSVSKTNEGIAILTVDGHNRMKSKLLITVLEEDRSIFSFTQNVYLELSNLCNYADVHKKCPVNRLQKQKNILPSKIVRDVLQTLGRFRFSGSIGFHTYNEPLIDPRLFEFIRYARKACPQSNIYICTNGYYLTEGLALELVEAGASSFFISAYSQQEEERLKKIDVPVDYTVQRMTLDDRLDLYEATETNCDKPCYSPLYQVIVTAEGRIALCCLDHQRRNCFGNLYEQSFEEAMKNDRMWLAYERLSKGDRFLSLCKRCTSYRGSALTGTGEKIAGFELSQSAKDGQSYSSSSTKDEISLPEPIEITNEFGDTLVIDIRQDLVDFTGLTLCEIDRLLKRHGYNARDEFRDCIARENSDHWFYLGSRYFLFENATHEYEIEDFIKQLLPEKAKIWEFGGGIGNMSLVLAAEGYDVSYTELSSLQKNFVEFRTHKYGLPINTINPWLSKPIGEFDLVLAIDVLEHIPDYSKVLIELCKSVKPEGIIWETSAFKKNPENPTHRIPDRHDYKKILTEHGFRRVYGVQDGKLWKKTEPSFDRQRIGTERTDTHILNFDADEFKVDDAGSAEMVKHNITRGLEELTSGNYALALDYFEEAYLNSDIVEKYCTQTVVPLMDKNLKKLELTAREALSKEPESSHRFAKLLVKCNEALRRMRAGLTKLSAADPQSALDLFGEAVTWYPRLPHLHFAIATAYSQLGDALSAIKACKAELQLQPEHSSVKQLLGQLKKATIAEYDRLQGSFTETKI